MQKSEDELEKFTEEAAKYYPGNNAFLKGTCDSTDGFITICEAVFGWTTDGKRLENKHLIICDSEEYAEWSAWIRRREKAHEHVERLKIANESLWQNMGGWNSKPIVMARDGEWRKFDSVAAAVKATGYNRKKIDRALKDHTEYLGWKWFTLEEWENKTDEEKQLAI